MQCHQVRSVPPSYFKLLLPLTNQFCATEPWCVLGDRAVVKLEALGVTRYVRVYGCSGHQVVPDLGGVPFYDMVGIGMSQSFEHSWSSYLGPKHGQDVQEFFKNNKPPQMCQFNRLLPDKTCDAERRFFEKHNLKPVTSLRPDTVYCPFFPEFHGEVQWTKRDFYLFEIAFHILPSFSEKLIAKDIYEFEELSVTQIVRLSDGREETVTLSYPAGFHNSWLESPKEDKLQFRPPDCPPLDQEILKSREGLIQFLRSKLGLYALPSQTILKSKSLVSLRSCLKQCGIDISECQEKDELLTITEKQRIEYKGLDDFDKVMKHYHFLLIYALYYVNTMETSLEAMDLVHNSMTPDTPLRYVLLYMYMGCHMYDQAQELMKKSKCLSEKVPSGDVSASNHIRSVWLWSSALIHYKRNGGKCKTAKNALLLGIKENPWILQALISTDYIPKTDLCPHSDLVAHVHKSQDKCLGFCYVQTFARDWYSTKGAYKWMHAIGKEYLKQKPQMPVVPPGSDFPSSFEEAILDSVTRKCADLSIDKQEDMNIPDFVLKCHACKAKREKEMKKCGKCKSVYYCSRECQVEDWANHKATCKQIRHELGE